MNLNTKYKFAILGVAVLCAAVNSPALTLGRSSGAVLVGQSLALTVPVRAEPDGGATSHCFEADVFYGDSQLEASRVSVHSEFSTGSLSGNVRITANALVNEPVVTVYLRSGCQHKVTRRYVLLAEVTDEAVRPIKEIQASRRSFLPPANPSVVVAPEAGAERTKSTTAIVPVRAERVSAAGAGSAPVFKPPAPRRAHLKLAPLDLTVDHDPTLKLSNEMHVGDQEDLQKRAEAVALWRALNASPEDILNAEGRRQAMDADLKSLQGITKKNRQTLEELTRRLNTAESERYFNPLVYGLLALLLACGAAGAFIGIRLRQAGQSTAPWWRDDAVSPAPQRTDDVFVDPSDASSMTAKSNDTASAVSSDSSTDNPAGPSSDLDIDIQLDEPGPKSMLSTQKAPDGNALPSAPDHASSRASGHADFANSMNTTLRALNTQEMLDVRQQAEFFMTLGQHEEAIGLLKDSLDRSDDSNPLVYLDLLKMLHTLGRKTEYDRYRMDFNAIFSGHVPSYAEFNQSREGLEAYPDVCQEISALWPTQEAVDYIEASMVRAPGQDPTRGFELEAFREMLLLHSIARRMASDADTGMQPFSAVRSLSSEAQPVAPIAQDINPVSVDLDLSELPPGNLIDFDAAELVSFKPPTRQDK